MTADTLTLKAESPLALHRRRASEQFAPTLDYLPASSVRGALADLYLAGVPERSQEPTFRDLFLSEVVRFSDFLPIPSDHHGLAHLMPATAVACKRFGNHESTSLTDGLLRFELASEMEQPDPLEHNGWLYCPDCRSVGRRERRDRLESGYYTSLEGFRRVTVRKRTITTTAIERASGTAAHGMLFSHEVIEESDVHEDVLFRGVVTLPEELRSKLIEVAGYRQRIAVGYGRSRGLGQLSVAGWGAAPAERQTIADRWAALNEAARTLWGLFERQPKGEYFSLTLQSHLALHDPAGEPILDGIKADDFKLPREADRRRSVLSAAVVPGWNAALNLPKPDTWALGRGSVLLFRLPPGYDGKPVIDRLQEIERESVGDRRAEGFGRMTACDPFHSYFLQREL
ncbi:MAG: hypothetical protein HYY65_01120 [Candidatus Tectomicrobia bacterium]|uniref:CRISPR type III-associated protein domain-containing protein n=1 Tax=Tectimicrobiota bacterium TaxID=2528274 RepID=A0A932M067_UNCTE|nr:hypothetical protein [Candidatus Tectomicrobia bacterium]